MEEEGSADSWARSVGEREEAAAMRSLLGKGADMWARPVSEEGARTQDERGAGELGLGRLAGLRRQGELGWGVEFGLEGKGRGLDRR